MSDRTIIVQDIVVNEFYMYPGEPFHIQRTKYSDGPIEYLSWVEGEVGTIESAGLRKIRSGTPITYRRLNKNDY